MPNERRKMPNAPLTAVEVTALRVANGSLTYAARETLPGVALGVSRLQQRVGGDPVAQDLLDYNALLKMGEQAVQRGMKIRFPCLDLDNFCLGLTSDAAFGYMPRRGSQCGFVVMLTLTENEVRTKAATCCMFKWGRTCIKRVMKSALEAEAAGFAMGFDRAEFVCALNAVILRGTEEPWETMMMKIPVIASIDAKSLYDLVAKPGGLPTERRVAINRWAAREVSVMDGTHLTWTPTHEMLADILTKQSTNIELMEATMEAA